MSNKPSASKLDTVIKLILIFCITLLSFSLGTFVGKQVSDSEYRKAAIEGDYEYFNAKNDGDENVDEGDLTQEDFESLTAEFVNTEKREIASAEASKKSKMKPDMKDKKATDKSEMMKKFVKTGEPKKMAADKKMKMDGKKKEMMASNKKMPAKDKASKEASRVATDKAPSKTPKKARKPQSILPNIANSAVGKYTVQVASYADEKEAKMHSANLKEKGWNAFYVPADVRGRKWFRVSVGLFSTSSSAEKFKSELVKDKAVSSAYVQKIVQ